MVCTFLYVFHKCRCCPTSYLGLSFLGKSLSWVGLKIYFYHRKILYRCIIFSIIYFGSFWSNIGSSRSSLTINYGRYSNYWFFTKLDNINRCYWNVWCRRQYCYSCFWSLLWFGNQLYFGPKNSSYIKTHLYIYFEYICLARNFLSMDVLAKF